MVAFIVITTNADANSTVIVGGEVDYPPYCFLDKNGKPAGFQVDLVCSIAQVMGMDIEIKLTTWAEAREGLETGAIDIISGMFYSDERAKIYDFSPPFTIVSSVIFARTDSPLVKEIDELRGKKIVVMRGEAMHDFATKNKLTEKLLLAETPDAVLKDLASGKCDYALGAQMPGLYWIKELGLSNIIIMGKPLQPFEDCFSVRKGNTLLLSRFTEGLSILKQTGEYQKLYEKWFGVLEARGLTWAEAVKYSAAVLVPLIFLLSMAFIWSWMLNRTVAQRTKELEESRHQLRTLSDNLPDGYVYQIIMDGDSRSFTYISAGVEQMHGISVKDVMNDPKILYDQILEEDRCLIAEREELTQKSMSRFYVEVRYCRPSGEVRWMLITSSPRKLPDHRIAADGLAVDITERIQAEKEKGKMQAQLTQAQKMESVGRLAGGVAHDFNNMLGVILGHTEMLLEYVKPGEPSYDDLEEIRKAANRSADLTRQLLAFARKQTVSPQVLDLNKTVDSMLKMLQRLIGEDIDLEWIPSRETWLVNIDPTQIDQILVNLCVNARDAIVNVGKLTIETGIATFDESYCNLHQGFTPGEYMLLAVSDNGCGMDAETQANIFEPFFTTKELGKGTGLGLATVYGIVKQNKGFLNIYSESGQGTTFKIYLPRHIGKSELAVEKGPSVPAVLGHETILLVEDEPSILKMTIMMLEKLGFRVLAASTPGEAFDLARTFGSEIHLLMTDVVMPEMNGRDLARNILLLYPNLKCLFMSGYTDNVIAHHGVLDKGVYFIQKPFTKKDLADKVRAALGYK